MEVGVQEAAARLGLSIDAVRRRVKAGKLKSRKESDGRVFVILPDELAAGDPLANATQELADARQALAAGQARIGELEKALAVAEAQLSAAQSERDFLRQAHAVALTKLPEPPVQIPERAESAAPRWWPFRRRQNA